MNHPPATDFFVPSGVQYAMQPYRGGFLVTDGHHNRVLRVRLDGSISEILALPNLVPTGLALREKTVYLALAGPVPHLAKDGKIIAFTATAFGAAQVASGAPLLVDVESGPGRALYALSQGHFTPGHPEGSPADPESGSLERIHPDGALTPVATELDRPTSLEFIGPNAYVITLNGEVWTIRDRSAPRSQRCGDDNPSLPSLRAVISTQANGNRVGCRCWVDSALGVTDTQVFGQALRPAKKLLQSGHLTSDSPR